MNRLLVLLLLVCGLGCGDELVLCDPEDPDCAGPQGEPGAEGAPGEPGAPGDQGPAGEPGVSCPGRELIATGASDLVAELVDDQGALILGESNITGYIDQVDLLSFRTFAVSSSGSCEPNSPVPNRLVFDKLADLSTADLMGQAAAQTGLESMSITHVSTGNGLRVRGEWTVTNASILDFQTGSGLPSKERWTLTFDTFEYTYFEYSSQGDLLSTETFCWDLVNDQACP